MKYKEFEMFKLKYLKKYNLNKSFSIYFYIICMFISIMH